MLCNYMYLLIKLQCSHIKVMIQQNIVPCKIKHNVFLILILKKLYSLSQVFVPVTIPLIQKIS